MLDLTVSEELLLPVPIERAREACERAITQLDWNIREQSPTTLLAREKGILGYDWLGTKTLTAPADLSVLLIESDNGARVQLNATLNYGKTSTKLFTPLLQSKLKKIRERLLAEIPRRALAFDAAAAPRCAPTRATSTVCGTRQTRGPHFHLLPAA